MLAKTAELISSTVSHVCLMVIWPHKRLASEQQCCRAERRRLAFAGKQINENSYICVCLSVLFGCHRVWFGCQRMPFFIHRTWFGCWLDLDKVRDHLRAKFKIPYSCVYRVPTSGHCDAGIKDASINIFMS